MKKKFIAFALLLCSCAPSSFEDLRIEGEVKTKKLAFILQKIETKEDLKKNLPTIQKKFTEIAEILIEIRNFPPVDAESSFASDQLFVELARLYEMPGGKELIESAQYEAIERLKKHL